MRPLATAVLGLCLLATATTVSAQNTFNPIKVQFQRSADHSAQLSDGTNLLTGYRLKHFLLGATSPIMVVDLCKPIPALDGTITITTSSGCPAGGLLFASPLAVNTTYVAKVTSYGPGGESAVSLPSNPFVLSGAPSAVTGSPIVSP